jgi:cytochrome c peroxidase
MKWRLIFAYMLAMLISGCDFSSKVESDYDWGLRDGFPQPVVPENNVMTQDRVELGRHLFYDKNLSFNRSQSCATCHQQQYAFAESRTTSIGSTGESHRRNAPALINIAYNKTLTWAHNGIKDLEVQLLLPMFGEEPIELGITGHEQEVIERFKTAKYRQMFEQAYPGEAIDFPTIIKALSSFVRSLVSLNSPFDRYAYDADDSALSESALRGMALFFSEKLECHHCHGGFNFTQSTVHQQQQLERNPFHNTGLYNVSPEGAYPAKDDGLYEITLNHQDHGKFRAPTLRNIALTAPYMHDGSIATLEDVIDFYAAGGRNILSGPYQGDGRQNPLKSPFIKGFKISEQEKQDLIAFLNALTDESFINNSAFSAPEND